jgi:hypothetical protein
MLSASQAKNPRGGGYRSPKLADWVQFFSELDGARWAMAGTITLCEVHPTTLRRRHHDDVIATAKHILYRINKTIFNHRAKRHQATIASVMILGDGILGLPSHIHFTFGKPDSMSYEELQELVERVIRASTWCNKEFDLQPYHDRGWLSYLLAHGTEKLIIECCRKASF